jgi:phosphonate transport system substrate-binding protein
MPLRLRSHLAPGLPHALFERIAEYLALHLDTGFVLTFDEQRSGPVPGDDDPFAASEVDLAFVCASSYVWLRAGGSPVTLAGTAWAPTDPRADGGPHYFADVLVRADDAAVPRAWPGVEGLAGRRVAFNDRVSLSGYHSLCLALAASGCTLRAIELVETGSHLRSLALLHAGSVDAAVVDANVWRRSRRDDATLAASLRVIDTFGPLPAQPLVAHAGLDRERIDAVRTVLLDAHRDPGVASVLADAELARFVPVGERLYAPLTRMLGVDAKARAAL